MWRTGEVTSPVRARFPRPASAFGDDLILEALTNRLSKHRYVVGETPTLRKRMRSVNVPLTNRVA
ncbi:MAG: hypothetical protein NZM10_06755 [Fimbriimonadales bacterium]|nr:hypothetical protein [Fimbriimonadales bacterium]